MRARIPSRLVTGLTAAVAALAIGGLTAAPAQAADDWYQVGNWTISAHFRDSGWVLTYPESPSGPSQAEGRGTGPLVQRQRDQGVCGRDPHGRERQGA